jgi:hypothetical protein
MNILRVILLTLAASASIAAGAEVTDIRLPEPISSFGAAVHDGYLYVYGGHRGEAHSHSRDNLAPAFVRIALNNPAKWESLPMETPVQGLALVSDGKFLYRVGGLTAKNSAGEDDDLHSQGAFRRFDPRTNAWSALPSLPEPRSSHDAIVLDGKLYVIGGWQLAGEGHGEWYETAWVFDLAAADVAWQPLPAPPFQNRALAVATWDAKVFALGGMTSDGEITRAVYAFDPKTNEWHEQAAIPGEGMQGFGASAWGHDTGLYTVGSDGHLYRLAGDGSAWESIVQLEQARFFHRLLPLDARSLIAVGGASHEVGHLDDIERIVVKEQ